MKRKMLILAMAVGLGALMGSGCLEDKVLEIVLTGETSADFSQDEATATWTNAVIIDMADEIGDILEDNGVERKEIKSAHTTSAHYGVISIPPSQDHDWTISGEITVTYNSAPATLLTYTSQSVQGALGQKISATLVPAGVAEINEALDDFIAGTNPVLTFTIVNSSTNPTPSALDPMVFDWRAWLAIQVIIEQTVEVPDPF